MIQKTPQGITYCNVVVFVDPFFLLGVGWGCCDVVISRATVKNNLLKLFASGGWSLGTETSWKSGAVERTDLRARWRMRKLPMRHRGDDIQVLKVKHWSFPICFLFLLGGGDWLILVARCENDWTIVTIGIHELYKYDMSDMSLCVWYILVWYIHQTCISVCFGQGVYHFVMINQLAKTITLHALFVLPTHWIATNVPNSQGRYPLLEPNYTWTPTLGSWW